jgi:hypothetical protein
MISLSYGANAQFKWPDGAKAAICLTYDDALDGHLDYAIPQLDSAGFKGTFYCTGNSPSLYSRMGEWRMAAKNGHELGNHTLFHPCLGVKANGTELETIEGVAQNGQLHPLQEGFWEKHGLQCGYCTPGMIMSARHLLSKNPDPSEAEIRRAISGNLCRCTGYNNIVAAVRYAAEKLKQSAAQETPA